MIFRMEFTIMTWHIIVLYCYEKEILISTYLEVLRMVYPISDCFCTVFVSTVFWKNFYKYNNFSYRLQGLDAGVLIGQSLEVANGMGFSTRVCYQFLDRSINHLLGLSEQEESVYAVIPISHETIHNLC